MKPAPSHPQAPRKPPRRRAPDAVHLAVVDATSGAAGTPTPTERQAIYLALLRKGEPPPKWISRQAAAWGISSVVVGDELVEARLILEASRTPDAALIQAHELIQQAVEAADQIDHEADAVDDPADRADIRGKAAGLQLKAAAELRQLYRKGGGLVDAMVEAQALAAQRQAGGLAGLKGGAGGG